MNPKKELINKIIKLSIHAGNAIMDIYDSNNIYSTKKKDSSPLTEADLVSNEIILNGLKKIKPSLPILSEESSEIDFTERSEWERYWLVDPLDGTKEFLKRNGEFTVNIALVENGKPIFGVVYVPSLEILYWGSRDYGSYEIFGKNKGTLRVPIIYSLILKSYLFFKSLFFLLISVNCLRASLTLFW